MATYLRKATAEVTPMSLQEFLTKYPDIPSPARMAGGVDPVGYEIVQSESVTRENPFGDDTIDWVSPQRLEALYSLVE